MDEPCVETWFSYTKMIKKHMWVSVADGRSNEYQFVCTRCGGYYRIKKRIFWGLSQMQYLVAVVLKRKYQR